MHVEGAFAARDAEAEAPLARQRRLSAERRSVLLRPPLEAFVHAEGALRVLATLQTHYRNRVQTRLITHRMEAYRELCAVTPTLTPTPTLNLTANPNPNPKPQP